MENKNEAGIKKFSEGLAGVIESLELVERIHRIALLLEKRKRTVTIGLIETETILKGIVIRVGHYNASTDSKHPFVEFRTEDGKEVVVWYENIKSVNEIDSTKIVDWLRSGKDEDEIVEEILKNH